MGFNDLANMEEVDVAQVWRENEPPAPGGRDDEPDEDDTPAQNEKLKAELGWDDPEHQRQHAERTATRHAKSQLAELATDAARQHLTNQEVALAKERAIEAAESTWDDDNWDDDEEAPAEMLQAFDALVQMPGLTEEDLREVAEATGYEEELAYVLSVRAAERQAQFDAYEQHARAEETRRDIAVEFGPEVAAAQRWEEIKGSLTPEQQAEGLEILMQLTVPSVEAGRTAAEMAARAAIDQDRRARRDASPIGSERLLRAFESVSPSSMLDRQTGEPLYYAGPEPIDVAYVAIGESDTPGYQKEQGRRWAKAAEGVMDAEARRQQAIDQKKAAQVKRALAQQEKEMERGLAVKKFPNRFEGT